MKKLNRIFIGILLVSSTLFSKVTGQNDTTEIIILHTNDMHAKIDNMAKLAYFVKHYRSKYNNVFLLSAGDNFTGNPVVDQYKNPGYPMVDLMNKISYDASAIGNHEFDYGQKNFNIYRKEADFPFISANIFPDNNAELNKPVDYIKLKTKNGISIGILGLTQTNKQGIPSSSPMKLKNISFKDPIEVAKKYKSYKDSSDIFIALTHLGYKRDLKLAKKIPVFDAIIGGHSHTKLQQGDLKGNTLVTQSGSYVNYFGVMTLKVVNHELISKKDTMIGLRDATRYDEEIAGLIKQYNNNPGLYIVIGYADDDITGKDELGSMMTDAMRDTLNVDIAFQNNGGIRTHQLPKGKITVKQIFELSPFGNTFVEYNLTPKQIKKLIKYTFKFHQNNELQVSGLIINLTVSEKKKLKKVKLLTSDKTELDKKTYSVVVNDYMATSYNLNFLKGGKKYTIIDAENTINFIKKNKTINYKGVKRVFENMK
ncbi:MAG: bifunctional metallophosphatase/5'-nucleotidase [Bacteroidales bacterium]|nr:bifunctional metallophosphatase/5'-nucleotidase [Bacteroidales bacterium]